MDLKPGARTTGGGAGPRAPRHLRFTPRRRRRWVWPAVGLVVVVGAAAAVVALTSSSSPSSHTPGPSSRRSGGSGSAGPATPTTPDTREQAALAAAVTTAPANGTSGVALNAPITVSTAMGHFSSVQVTSAGGQALAGALDPTASHWTSAAVLAPSTTYQVRAVVAGPGNVTATAVSSFTTLTPTARVGVSVWPGDGLSVGVGQPIVLTFTHSVNSATARQTVLSHLKVAMSAPVPVGAYWFSSHELHLRPQTYWPSGERVSFSDNLEGWNAGSGMWGEGSLSVAFSIGDARISTAYLATHEMTVTDNGKVVTTYPISAGRDQYPTMNGIHLVLDRESKVQMISSTVGIPVNSPNGYNETVFWDVHISDSGEYVHAAPWSVGAQGNTNVSHGCINISTANAEQFFNFSRVGDIVNVVGGPRAPVAGDHGVMDWDTAWSAFTPVPVTKA